MAGKNKNKRILVTFTPQQWLLIERLRGEFGQDSAEIVRNIVLSWLSEKSFISDSAKAKNLQGKLNE